LEMHWRGAFAHRHASHDTFDGLLPLTSLLTGTRAIGGFSARALRLLAGGDGSSAGSSAATHLPLPEWAPRRRRERTFHDVFLAGGPSRRGRGGLFACTLHVRTSANRSMSLAEGDPVAHAHAGTATSRGRSLRPARERGAPGTARMRFPSQGALHAPAREGYVPVRARNDLRAVMIRAHPFARRVFAGGPSKTLARPRPTPLARPPFTELRDAKFGFSGPHAALRLLQTPMNCAHTLDECPNLARTGALARGRLSFVLA